MRSLKRLRSNYEPRLQSSEGLMGRRTRFQVGSQIWLASSCWLHPASPQDCSSVRGTWQVAFFGAVDPGEQGGSGGAPCDLAPEVIHRHFHHIRILSVAQLSPERPPWKGTPRGHERQDAGSSGPISEAGSHASQSLSPHLSTLPTTPPISNSLEILSLAFFNVDTLG